MADNGLCRLLPLQRRTAPLGRGRIYTADKAAFDCGYVQNAVSRACLDPLQRQDT